MYGRAGTGAGAGDGTGAGIGTGARRPPPYLQCLNTVNITIS